MRLGGFPLQTYTIATRTMARKNTKQAKAYRDLCGGPPPNALSARVTTPAIARVIAEYGAVRMITHGATTQYASDRPEPGLPRYTYTMDDQNGSRPKPR